MYNRIILKLSGEIFQGDKDSGISYSTLSYLRDEIIETAKLGVRIGIVLGGGNIFRGDKAEQDLKIERVVGDYAGMLSTLLNALILQNSLEKQGIETRVMSTIEVAKLAEPYIRRRAIRHLEKGRICIFTCGTGSPYFTTDTAAVLRAAEIEAECVLKGTKVDGVYEDDPMKVKDAKLYKTISYAEILKKKLKFMDLTAITLAHENKLPIIVFNIKKKDNLKNIVKGEPIGTIIK